MFEFLLMGVKALLDRAFDALGRDAVRRVVVQLTAAAALGNI